MTEFEYAASTSKTCLTSYRNQDDMQARLAEIRALL
jgi:hypothetical protein